MSEYDIFQKYKELGLNDAEAIKEAIGEIESLVATSQHNQDDILYGVRSLADKILQENSTEYEELASISASETNPLLVNDIELDDETVDSLNEGVSDRIDVNNSFIVCEDGSFLHVEDKIEENGFCLSSSVSSISEQRARHIADSLGRHHTDESLLENFDDKLIEFKTRCPVKETALSMDNDTLSLVDDDSPSL
ncbi:MAG: hypothetical protein ACI9TY_000965 [Alphaproteobacteria bacterium]|jgi:hypothetical protein